MCNNNAINNRTCRIAKSLQNSDTHDQLSFATGKRGLSLSLSRVLDNSLFRHVNLFGPRSNLARRKNKSPERAAAREEYREKIKLRTRETVDKSIQQ